MKTSERWRARERTPACPGHVDDVGASSCGRTIIQRATRVDGGSDGGRGRWTLDGGCWMVDAAGGMAVHEVVDFTRSIAEPAAPPPCARAQTRSKSRRLPNVSVSFFLSRKSSIEEGWFWDPLQVSWSMRENRVNGCVGGGGGGGGLRSVNKFEETVLIPLSSNETVLTDLRVSDDLARISRKVYTFLAASRSNSSSRTFTKLFRSKRKSQLRELLINPHS